MYKNLSNAIQRGLNNFFATRWHKIDWTALSLLYKPNLKTMNNQTSAQITETHYQDMWVTMNSFYDCPLTGIPMPVSKYIESITDLTYNLKIEKVTPKQHYFNTGPTAYSKAVSYVITHRNGEKHIFLIRERNDGFGFMCFKWSGTYSEWESYSTAKAQKEFLKVMDRFNEM